MSLEGTRRGEFAKLMAYHILRHKNWHVLTSVVNGNGQTDHFRHNHGSARPSLDGPFSIRFDRTSHFLYKMRIDKRPFFD
jgi:hypothetical protein